MSEKSSKPADPAGENIEQSNRETNTFEGQQGHGVEFGDGKFEGTVEETPPSGRSGSFETGNQGGYGTGQPDAEGERHAEKGSNAPSD